MEKRSILYAENDLKAAEKTGRELEGNGFRVYTVHNGIDAWIYFQKCHPDVVLLSQEIAGKNGIEVSVLIRQADPVIPILLLSSNPAFCAIALRSGIDDFIRKDSDMEEVCARIEAACRRSRHKEAMEDTPHRLSLSSRTTFDCISRILTVREQTYKLSATQAQILKIFCQNRNIQLSYSFICQRLWNNTTPGKIHLLQDYISKLRAYIGQDPDLDIINQYGTGYSLYNSKL